VTESGIGPIPTALDTKETHAITCQAHMCSSPWCLTLPSSILDSLPTALITVFRLW
jgi:hypothetical protein